MAWDDLIDRAVRDVIADWIGDRWPEQGDGRCTESQGDEPEPEPDVLGLATRLRRCDQLTLMCCSGNGIPPWSMRRAPSWMSSGMVDEATGSYNLRLDNRFSPQARYHREFLSKHKAPKVPSNSRTLALEVPRKHPQTHPQ